MTHTIFEISICDSKTFLITTNKFFFSLIFEITTLLENYKISGRIDKKKTDRKLESSKKRVFFEFISFIINILKT